MRLHNVIGFIQILLRLATAKLFWHNFKHRSQCNWDSLQQNENILHLTQMQFINVFHFFAAAHCYGDALMQADRLDIEHGF